MNPEIEYNVRWWNNMRGEDCKENFETLESATYFADSLDNTYHEHIYLQVKYIYPSIENIKLLEGYDEIEYKIVQNIEHKTHKTHFPNLEEAIYFFKNKMRGYGDLTIKFIFKKDGF